MRVYRDQSDTLKTSNSIDEENRQPLETAVSHWRKSDPTEGKPRIANHLLNISSVLTSSTDSHQPETTIRSTTRKENGRHRNTWTQNPKYRNSILPAIFRLNVTKALQYSALVSVPGFLTLINIH